MPQLQNEMSIPVRCVSKGFTVRPLADAAGLLSYNDLT